MFQGRSQQLRPFLFCGLFGRAAGLAFQPLRRLATRLIRSGRSAVRQIVPLESLLTGSVRKNHLKSV
jgi:hypothetical protein